MELLHQISDIFAVSLRLFAAVPKTASVEMVAWEDVGESSSCLPQMCRQWMSAERNCTCTTTRPSGFLNAKHAIILSPRSARDEFCISILPYVDYTAIWVTALRTRKYLKVCLQVGQLFRRLLQLEEVICFFFLPTFFLLFFSGAPCFSLQLS